MLSIEEIANRLKDRNLTRVAESVGLSCPTVFNMSKGIAGNYNSVKKISDYLESNP